jgi:phospholipid-binding lipoprotein MlaA
MLLQSKPLSILLLASTLGLAACASTPDNSAANDPLEGVNRAVFGFNEVVDKAVIGPVARGYGKVPAPIRDRVRDFVRNITSPLVLIHDVLQLEGARASDTAARMLVNTTIGAFGLVDIATPFGLPYHSEDAGQTFGAHGVGEGPYIVLPLLGPSTTRDTVGRVVDLFLDPVSWIEGIGGFRAGTAASGAIDMRERLDPVIADTRKNSLDYYAASRSLYRQNRTAEIANHRASDSELADIPVY